MADRTYRFTRAQLEQALRGAIEMYLEFRDTHGRSDEDARLYGAGEILDGMDADQELAANDPTERLKLQLPDAHADIPPAPARLCDKCGAALDNLQGEYLMSNGYGGPVTICHRCYPAMLSLGFTVVAQARGVPADATPDQLRQVKAGILAWNGNEWEMPRGSDPFKGDD